MIRIHPDDRDRVKREIADSLATGGQCNVSYRIVTPKGDLVAFTFVMVNENNAAHLTTIGVAPEHRRRGVAQQLIEHIEAAGDYMCIRTADNSLILRETMKDLERRLDPRVFQRVHRSWIVNLNQVRQVKPHTNGECFLVLDSGADVKVSRSYRDVVARFVH